MLTQQQEPSKAYVLAGIFTLSLRLIVGWTYFSAFWRRLVLENKLIPDGTGYIGEKFNHFLPNSIGIKPIIEYLVSTPDLLWWAMVIFTLVEGIVGLLYMLGFFTRLMSIGVFSLAFGILLGSGWLGTTCLDEWQIGILGVSAGFTIFLSGGGKYSLDYLLLPKLSKNKWLVWLTSGELPLSIKQFSKVAISGAVLLFILTLYTNQLQCPSGLKVQLLYWNGKEYAEIFPKGTRIGFVVARAGYKKDGTDVTTKNAYSFKNKTNPVVNGDVSGMYYSTPVLNKWGKSQAVTRQLDGYNCCVTGFDIRPFGDNQSDYDFNDVMLKVTATPEKAIEPGEDIPVEEEVVVTESIHGTLAFEDQWPNAGDYDLNDFVVNYAYGLGKNTENKITSIKLRFKPIAKGAAAYTKIGFGIELPLAESYIDAAKVMGATFESGNSKATFVIWEDVSRLFPNINGFVNTEKGTSFVSAAEVEITIPLTIPVDNVSMMKFNPFIFVNNRSHEIHLTDFAPTSKMDTNLLQTADDCSDASRNIYYRMEDMSCWALDFPRTSASDPAWRYPKEKSSVVKAYKNYSKWVINKTDLSWFDFTISENVDEDELY